MVRKRIASSWPVALVPLAGCSLILDFSDGAIPRDAAVAVDVADGPYSEAECARGEPNDTAATATVLTPADTGVTAATCAQGGDDRDFYRFTVPAMTAKVEIRIAFDDRANGDLDLRLFDKAGQVRLAQSVGFGAGEAIVCPAASPPCAALAADDYVFEVYPAVAGATNRYTISLVVTPASAR